MKKEVRILLCVLAVGFMLFWLLSVAYCEVLTLRYGHEFADSWEQNTMLSQPDSIKVPPVLRKPDVLAYQKT